MTITITGETERQLCRLIASGEYDSAEEAIASLLRQQRPPSQFPDADGVKPIVANGEHAALREKLSALRAEYIAGGGTLLTADEINRDVALRRGERDGGA